MKNIERPKVISSISHDRMGKYRNMCEGGDENALKLYRFNLAFSEAFYTPLQCVEVCLRNKLHEAMSKAYGADWMTNGGPPLDDDALEKIHDIIDFRKRGKKQVTAPDIVAEISFSFWVGLLGPRYDATLWRQTLHIAFPNKPKGFKRSTCHGRFNAIRRFRNRIAHHEPIINKVLPKQHAEIMEAISWMCEDKAAWTLNISRVPFVNNNYQEFLKRISPDPTQAPVPNEP